MDFGGMAEINEVIWWGNGWHYSNYHAGAMNLYDDYEHGEVIGNIYEDKHLLDK
jgi:hypothetical protein